MNMSSRRKNILPCTVFAARHSFMAPAAGMSDCKENLDLMLFPWYGECSVYKHWYWSICGVVRVMECMRHLAKIKTSLTKPFKETIKGNLFL